MSFDHLQSRRTSVLRAVAITKKSKFFFKKFVKTLEFNIFDARRSARGFVGCEGCDFDTNRKLCARSAKLCYVAFGHAM